MIWLRYQVKFSSGRGPIEWLLLSLEPMSRWDAAREAKGRVAELANEYDHSEHFRGIDYRTSRRPPRSVVEARLAHVLRLAASATKEAKLLRAKLRFLGRV